MANAPGFRRRELKVETFEDQTTTVTVELKPERRREEKIRVEGLEVTIADEMVFLIEATGEQLTLQQYRDYTRNKIIEVVPTQKTLHQVWIDPERRRNFLEDLRKASIHPEVLAEVLGVPDADTYDLLAHLAFDAPLRTRTERAVAFRNREQSFINRYREEARRVILELLDKYRAAGVEEIADPRVFGVSPFREWGGAVRISQWFGGPEALGKMMLEMQRRLYQEVRL